MEKSFEQELSLIKNPIVKEILEEGIALLPDYFYKIPASSTGKYHPTFALGEGGLYRHVKATIGIATDLFRIYNFSEIEQDIIIASLILHDGWKQGSGITNNTVHKHPIVATNTLIEKIDTDKDSEKALYLILICENIARHMGQWNTCKWDKTVLPTPETEMQKFVHLCDYLASRKSLEYNFSARI